MENVKILIDGIQKDVYGLFYVFESKYYFIYTEKELDENDYVILYMSQIGKETKNTETGPVETGYMVGVEVTNPEEQQKVQTSISYIVEDKKNNTINPQIQYLPMNMLTYLKIVSKKRFRLLKSIMVDNFKLPFEGTLKFETQTDNLASEMASVIPTVQTDQTVSVPSSSSAISAVPTVSNELITPVTLVQSSNNVQPVPLQNLNTNVVNANESQTQVQNSNSSTSMNETNVIIDYRSKYFEEEEKNKELQAQVEELIRKLDEIKKVIE